MDRKKIIDSTQLNQIIRRLSYQIYENNFSTEAITLIGIGNTGQKIRDQIRDELVSIDSKLKISLGNIVIDKHYPEKLTELTVSEGSSGDSVVLIDDVLNTGKTVIYCLQKLLNKYSSQIELAVLVDRGHKKFPVSATYTGYELATTLEEHVEVIMVGGKESSVYLY